LAFFECVAPAGAASAIDALMDGAITEFRQRRMFASAVGEVLVVSTGRNEVCAEFVVFAGLGSFDTFSLQVLETVAENVAHTMAPLNIEEFATVPKRVRTDSKHVTKDMKERIERSVGLAEAFLRGGAANYIDTYWPVGDASAKQFENMFCGALLDGQALGDACTKAAGKSTS
jgi:hypothetical protein